MSRFQKHRSEPESSDLEFRCVGDPAHFIPTYPPPPPPSYHSHASTSLAMAPQTRDTSEATERENSLRRTIKFFAGLAALLFLIIAIGFPLTAISLSHQALPVPASTLSVTAFSTLVITNSLPVTVQTNVPTTLVTTEVLTESVVSVVQTTVVQTSIQPTTIVETAVSIVTSVLVSTSTESEVRTRTCYFFC